jgi:HEPN domain-containing protein
MDLRAGEIDLTANPPLLEDVAFHAQQLAEKSLKAFLVWYDQPFRKTHDLTEIGQECVELDQTLAQISKRAEALSDYAWKYRYPGDPGGLTFV